MKSSRQMKKHKKLNPVWPLAKPSRNRNVKKSRPRSQSELTGTGHLASRRGGAESRRLENGATPPRESIKYAQR